MPKRVRILWVITCVVILLGFFYTALKTQSEQAREASRKRQAEARKQYEEKRARKKAALEASKRINQLRELVALGKYPEAEQMAQEILKQDPENAWAYTWWGVALVNEDKLDAALEKFKTSSSLNPNLAKTYIFWGLTLQKMGRHKEAIDKYENALLLDPENSNGYAYWGAALGQLGDHRNAIAKLEKALDLNPYNELAYGVLVDQHYHLEQYDKAWQVVERARQLNKTIPEGTLKRLQGARPKPE